MGITPWSPLAAGFLAGKSRWQEGGAAGEGRPTGPNPFGNSKFNERNWRILDVLKAVAMAWASGQLGITSTILGASKLDRLRDNLASTDIKLDAEQLQTLNQATAPEPTFPHPVFAPAVNQMIFGGKSVQGWS